MKLYFIRHGQSASNQSWCYTGQTDIPLTETGRQQAMDLRPVLQGIPFDRVFSSDLSRAMDTQRLALPGYEAEQTPLLREMDVGTLAGQNITACREKYGRIRDYTPFGGENRQLVCDRLQTFLRQLERSPCENAAAFSHSGVMKCMLQIVLGTDYDRLGVQNQNCNVAVFSYDGNRWSLLAWNVAAWR